MKALVLVEYNRFEYKDVAKPEAGPGEVLIAVEAVDVAAALRKGGALTLIGNLAPSVDFSLQSVVTREISVNGSCASSGEYPTCLELIARGAVEVDAMVSTTAPLAEGAGWFERLYRGEPGLMKVILTP